jgi:hypothetical protein
MTATKRHAPEITPEMIEAGMQVYYEHDLDPGPDRRERLRIALREIYRAMVLSRLKVRP